MKHLRFLPAGLLATAIFVGSLFPGPAKAQMGGSQTFAPAGYCQASAASLASAVDLSACVAASFTGTCSGTTLTASSVTGAINPGWKVTGTGVPTGTTIVRQISIAFGASAGAAGTYQTSAACSSSGASLTTVGPPNNANVMLFQAETQNIRWRDDGAVPTTTSGVLLLSGQAPALYVGTLANIRFINATAGSILNISFYRTGAP